MIQYVRNVRMGHPYIAGVTSMPEVMIPYFTQSVVLQYSWECGDNIPRADKIAHTICGDCNKASELEAILYIGNEFCREE